MFFLEPYLGQYMFLEASAPSKRGDVAILDSQMISVIYDNSVFCVSLWYFMYGKDIGWLNVTTQVGNNRSTYSSRLPLALARGPTYEMACLH